MLFGLFAVLATELYNLTKSLKEVMSKQKCFSIILTEKRLGGLGEPIEATTMGAGSPKETIWKPVSDT